MTSPEPTLDELKHEARCRAREVRSALSAEALEAAARGLAEQLLALPELRQLGAGVLLAYAALPEEIDPAETVAELARAGARVAYPRVDAPGVLGLHEAADDELAPGRFGVREPLESAPRIELGDVDVALVPGVAFDLEGFRLGHGGGYYDRLLPLLRNGALRIGLAFDEQVLAEPLPAEEHDVRLDLVVTPTRVIRLPQR